MPEFVVITGLSGAGRSEAAKRFEDLGWFVIDNLPPALMPKVRELASAPGSRIDRVALVVGPSTYQEEIPAALAELRSGAGGAVRIVFLESRTPVLVRRYEASRRRHPFEGGGSLAEAIEAERQAMDVIRERADLIIDTSDLNVHQLRDRIIDLFGDGTEASSMQTRIMSFGYKHGLPVDVDVVLDCRFLPNPHWVEELRPQTGLDDAVRDYVLDQPATGAFLEHLGAMLELLVPAFQREGKAYLTVAFGCTGGRHRSVAVAEAVADLFRSLGVEPSVTHRDIGR